MLNYIVSDLSNTINISHSMVNTVFNKPAKRGTVRDKRLCSIDIILGLDWHMHLPSWNMVVTFENHFLWSEIKNDLFGRNQAQRIW